MIPLNLSESSSAKNHPRSLKTVTYRVRWGTLEEKSWCTKVKYPRRGYVVLKAPKRAFLASEGPSQEVAGWRSDFRKILATGLKQCVLLVFERIFEKKNFLVKLFLFRKKYFFGKIPERSRPESRPTKPRIVKICAFLKSSRGWRTFLAI